MRLDPGNGMIEIGNINWAPAIARSRIAMEALFPFWEHVVSLGYRQLE